MAPLHHSAGTAGLTARRAFLRQTACAGALAGSAFSRPSDLATIALGNKRVSRLVAGSNPVFGGTHLSRKLGDHMKAFFTLERTVSFLKHCEEEGITAFQSAYAEKVRDALRAVWEKGSRLQWICLSDERDRERFGDILALKPIAIVHHGTTTDGYFRAGQQRKVADFVKMVHDKGPIAGISTHNPEHLRRAGDSGWEEQFYMCCFYDIYRAPEEIKAKVGDSVVGELYLASDPERMTGRMRQIGKPCLGFKILAASRLCWDKASTERAFAFAFENIKPTDGIIVGMYPVFSDEVREDAGLVRKHGSPPSRSSLQFQGR
jgi:hypothetical protein